jgi:hypothetical protein
MVAPTLSRRQALQLGVNAGLALTSLGLLGGCGREAPRLRASRGDLPAAWATQLPRSWQLQWCDDPAAVEQQQANANGRAGLLQLSDGWANGLDRAAVQPFGQPALLARLTPAAAPVARLFAPEGAPALAFPWSYGPWVLLLRDRPDLARRAEEGWQLLLDPSLRGRLVLPSSPRVSIALMEADPGRLRQLRRQALAYDDRDGLSLLLAGEAEAAVLPRQRVLPLLRRDPRLRILLPATGAPLTWNLLLRPSGGPEPPGEWLAEVLEPPLLARLLAAGWVPPLPRGQLQEALRGFPDEQAQLLLPPEPVLARCPSLPPLEAAERQRLQILWDQTAA